MFMKDNHRAVHGRKVEYIYKARIRVEIYKCLEHLRNLWQ